MQAAAHAQRCRHLLSEAVLTLDCELPVSVALAQLALVEVTSAPVVDDNHVLVGLVTTRALALLSDEDGAEVEDAMSTGVVSALEGTTVAEAVRLLADHGLDRLPVIDAEGRLVGVVTAMNLLGWLSARL